jgi:predicted unusual protein kinase regulating ubiquinone biosynthesis (AarF/ABC1/UbiB family)
VLVTELVGGRSYDETIAGARPDEKKRYGIVLFRFVFESLYLHGMFNADPHPGNYVFLPAGRVAFLDFGCVQRFPPDALEAFVAVRRAVVAGVRGDALYSLLSAAYQLPDGLDRDVRALIEQFVLSSFAPLLRPQPFTYDRSTRACSSRTSPRRTSSPRDSSPIAVSSRRR